MLKLLYRNILFFIFLKYFLFYILLMFKYKDYTLIEIGNLKSAENVFFYLWTFLFLPICIAILFSVPIFISLKVKNRLLFILIIVIVWLGEYFFYTFFASQEDKLNGVYNALIGIIIFVFMFYKSILKVFKVSGNQVLLDSLLDI